MTSGLMTVGANITSAFNGVMPVFVNKDVAVAVLRDIDYLVSINCGTEILEPRQNFINVKSNMLGVCVLKIPTYEFNPSQEIAYLSHGIHKVQYNDVYMYNIDNVEGSAQINRVITQGISNIKRITLMPRFTKDANGGVSPHQSIVDLAPSTTSPYCFLTNLNVQLSGQNIFSNAQTYIKDQYRQQTGEYANNNYGNLIAGSRTGLLNEYDFNTNYQIYSFDVSRHLAVEDNISKSISITCKNASPKNVDIMVFVEYRREFSINIENGTLVG
jgi:hypothetical protein